MSPAKIKLNATSGGGSVSIEAPASSSNNRVFTFPDTADATILTTNSTVGKVIQLVSQSKTDTASFSVASDTVYHYTDTSLRVTITPTSASSTLYIMGEVTVGRDLLNVMFVHIGQDGSTLASAQGDSSSSRTSCTSAGTNNNTSMPVSIPFHIEIPAGNTSQRYYNLGFHHGSSSSRTVYLNRGSDDPDAYYSPRSISTITVMEVS